MDTLVDNSYRGSRSQDGNYADMWPRPSKSAETKSLGQVSRVGDVQPATALASSHLGEFFHQLDYNYRAEVFNPSMIWTDPIHDVSLYAGVRTLCHASTLHV